MSHDALGNLAVNFIPEGLADCSGSARIDEVVILPSTESGAGVETGCEGGIAPAFACCDLSNMRPSQSISRLEFERLSESVSSGKPRSCTGYSACFLDGAAAGRSAS